MHVILSLVHLQRLLNLALEISPALETYRMGLQMVSVLAEILNFTTMLTLLVQNEEIGIEWEEMTTEEQTFTIWIIIEALVFLMTVATNVGYVLLRSFIPDNVTLDMDS